MKAIITAALVATGLFATATFAQDADPSFDPQTEAGLAAWAAYDADKTGDYSYDEVLKKYANLKKSDFDAADANRDGIIEKEELAALMKVAPTK